jgi:hypothetical protein
VSEAPATAKLTADTASDCGRTKTLMDSELRRSSSRGRLRTVANGRPAVFKTVCGPRKSKVVEPHSNLRVWYHARASLFSLLSELADRRDACDEFSLSAVRRLS